MEFNSLFILGRQPEISLAELESIFGKEKLASFGEHALSTVNAENVPFWRLGGTLKTARILTELPSSNWLKINKYLIKNLPDYISELEPGKFTLGLSVYGLGINAETINKTTLRIKKALRTSSRSVRIVPNKSADLNTAQILHNNLTSKKGWELIVASDGQKTYLAQTLFVQDIDAYADRDQARPKRDSLVGMLPPKLAQIIVNLAVGSNLESAKSRTTDKQTLTIYDPFCGTGVVLQEASLMGFNVVGSDISQKMVDYSLENLKWIKSHYPGDIGDYDLCVADSTKELASRAFDFVASEVYLGPVLRGRSNQDEINKAIDATNPVIENFLKVMHQKTFYRACLALPCWELNGQFIHLPILDQLSNLGYNRVSFVHSGLRELVYYRPGQAVARELVVLEKKVKLSNVKN